MVQSTIPYVQNQLNMYQTSTDSKEILTQTHIIQDGEMTITFPGVIIHPIHYSCLEIDHLRDHMGSKICKHKTKRRTFKTCSRCCKIKMLSYKSQSASIPNLEGHIGQIASALTNRCQGNLQSTEANLNGKEHCKAATLRSRKELQSDEEEKGISDPSSSISLEEKEQEIEEGLIEEKPAEVSHHVYPHSPKIEQIDK